MPTVKKLCENWVEIEHYQQTLGLSTDYEEEKEINPSEADVSATSLPKNVPVLTHVSAPHLSRPLVVAPILP